MAKQQYEQYEINEADIDKAIHALSVFYGEQVTPEEAIDFLIWSSAHIHAEVEHGRKPDSIDNFIKLYPRLKKREDELERQDVR
jgi:hypothetical protein